MTELVNGVDIIEIPRIKSVADRYGERFLRRIYTEREVAYCRGRAPQLASRFAAKEAVMKALGTGIRGVRWRDIEIARKPGGPPTVVLHGTAANHWDKTGIRPRSVLELVHQDRLLQISAACIEPWHEPFDQDRFEGGEQGKYVRDLFEDGLISDPPESLNFRVLVSIPHHFTQESG